MKTLQVGLVGLVLWLGACSVPSGPQNGLGATVSGTVSGSQGGSIVNATVTITPTGAAALPAVQTSSGGAYSVGSVPTGDGSITVSNLPSDCEPTATIAYTGLKNGGKRTVNFIVGCNVTLP